MTSSSRRRAPLALSLPALTLTLTLALALAPTPAHAQPHTPTAQELETARTLYKEGKELRAQGNLKGALEKLQAAHALGNTPVTGIELARTYAMVGQIVEAREVCLYIARMPVASDETEKSVEARSDAAKLAEELRPRIPALVVKVNGLAEGDTAHLSIDGVTVPDAAFAEPLKVDPGKHLVSLRIGDGAAAREVHGEANVAEGQTGELTLTVPPAPVVVPPPPPPPPPPQPAPAQPQPMPLLVKLGFGTAIAGSAVGLIAGLTALNKKGQLDSECGVSKVCSDGNGGLPDLDTAQAWATVSTVAFVVGGAGLVAGIVGLLTEKDAAPAQQGRERVSPWLGLGAAGVHGRF
ncbi:MAG TPA: hypothetical protein VIF15_11225 [Polyangiaceae bacterium]|jgi:hypothetical protein